MDAALKICLKKEILNGSTDSNWPGDMDQSDESIVRRVLDGDVDAFERLLKTYKQYVMKIVNRHLPYNEIEETTHEVFIRAYQSLPTFRFKSGFKQWLSGIAVRTCYDFWRKTYRSKEVAMSDLTEKHREWLETVITAESDEEFYEKGKAEEAKELLERALSRLSPEDRMVTELVYLEGMSGKEAADLLGWSVANVKVRSFRSRNRLKKILSEYRETLNQRR